MIRILRIVKKVIIMMIKMTMTSIVLLDHLFTPPLCILSLNSGGHHSEVVLTVGDADHQVWADKMLVLSMLAR